MADDARSTDAPIGTLSVITATSPSMSIPQDSSANDRIAWGEETVRTALIHQWIGVKAFGYFRAARLAYQFDMIDIGRAVGPLISARQWRMGAGFIERLAHVAIGVQPVRHHPKSVGFRRPVVQDRLHGRGDVGNGDTAGQIARNDNQFSIARVIFQGGEFHLAGLLVLTA